MGRREYNIKIKIKIKAKIFFKKGVMLPLSFTCVRFQDPVSSFPLNLKRGENLFRTSQDKLSASLSISKVFLAVYYINLHKLALNLLLIILNTKTIYELVWTYGTLQKLVLHSPTEVSLILGLNVAD
jgi:hypothetical protein